MIFKNSFLPILGLLAWLAPQAAAQDYIWIDTQFHRVYLRNGNFVDGKITLVNDREVRLDILSGNMTFRRDMVDRIELVKIRTLGEKPKLVPPPKKNTAAKIDGPAAGRDRTRVSSLAPPAIDPRSKERIDAILSSLRIAAPDQKDDLVPDLARLGSPAAPYLASMLGTLDDESCKRLTQALIKIKESAALPFLIDALQDGRAYVRIHALLVIGDTGTVDSALPVRALLGDNQEAVRASAIMALQRLGDSDSIPEIIDCLGSGEGPVRVAAINALLDLGRKSGNMDRVAEGLRNALDRASEQGVLDFISALGRTGKHDQWSIVGRYLREGDPKTRATAAEALITLAAPESQELVLVRLSQEDDKRTRINLAGVVRELKAMKAIEPLIGWLQSQDPDIAAAAGATLKVLTRQSFGVDHALWSQWWDQARER